MLEGDLSDFTLPDVLRLLAFTSKSGRLQLRHEGAVGRIDLLDGRVRDASADTGRLALARRLLGTGLVDGETLRGVLPDDGTLPSDLAFARALVARGGAPVGEVAEVLREQTLDAVFDLCRWSVGEFRFDARLDDAGAPPDLAVAVDELLGEVDRRLADWEGFAGKVGAGDQVVTVQGPQDPSVVIDRAGWQLLGLVDGRRTVDELVGLSGRGQFATRRTLVGLLELGVVHLGASDGPGTVAHLVREHRALAQAEARSTGGVVPAPEPSVVGDLPVPTPAPAPGPASTPVPVPVRQAPIPDVEVAAPIGGIHARPAGQRLTTDPGVDEETLRRLIDGVERL